MLSSVSFSKDVIDKRAKPRKIAKVEVKEMPENNGGCSYNEKEPE